jgi:uncharacterized membrane protein
MSTFAQTLTIICAIGAAAMAGVFFAYSTFTMSGLRRLEPSSGAAAMQAINREAPKPPLMLLLFGTGAASIVLVGYALANLDESAAAYQLIAGALYIVGVIVMTGAYHVPRNNRLDRLDPNSVEGVNYWSTYLREWVRMNHVRTLAPLLAAILLTISLVIY